VQKIAVSQNHILLREMVFKKKYSANNKPATRKNIFLVQRIDDAIKKILNY
jgi:hypothetical protein